MMRFSQQVSRIKLFHLFVTLVSLLMSASSLATQPEDPSDFSAVMQPLLKRYCVNCHGDEKAKGGIHLEGPRTRVDLLRQREAWLQVLEQLESEEMPPKDPIPTQAERELMVHWLKQAMTQVDWAALHDPGRLSLARLTTVEYRNSIRDIFGVDLQAGVFLGKDPEGNTGFANDRESLTFPLFAFDDFMREAERAVDAYLGYGREPWHFAAEAEDTWRANSDKSTSLSADESGVVIRDPNNPFAFEVEAPYSGMYEFRYKAGLINGEPMSGLAIHLDGRLLERMVIMGFESRWYSLRMNLSAGAHTLTLAFDRDRAPIIQPAIEPRSVPDSIVGKIASSTRFPEVDMPRKFMGNNEAIKAFERFNAVLKGYVLTQALARNLIERDDTSYENYQLRNTSTKGAIQISNLSSFKPTKVPFNLSAGKIAVLLGIPQARFETQLEQEHGFSHGDYKRTIREYLDQFAAKHPERIRKVPGQVIVDRYELNSHALSPEERDPAGFFATLDQAEGREILLKKHGRRAFGRELRPTELSRLVSLHDATLRETGSSHEAIRDALVGLLVSPPFLLHYVERPESQQRELPSREIAARLSRFLRLSIPDERLLQLADEGRLAKPEILTREVDRLVEQTGFIGVMELFVEQWLNLESLNQAEGLNHSLIQAMRQEPLLLLVELIRENRSLLDLINTEHTYLNEMLARHYDIAGVEGNHLRPVRLETDRRGGLLAMAGPLVATSTPQRTSPVTRGAWIVEQLLGVELPPPPPSVPELKVDTKARTVREELELHRQSPQCSGCHDKIDPFGFVLEHYDQRGAWRDREGRRPVDSSAALPDGSKLEGVPDLRAYLTGKRRNDFARNVIERLMEFALGRELRYTDEATIIRILSEQEPTGFRARSILHAIATSEPFLRQNDGSDANQARIP